MKVKLIRLTLRQEPNKLLPITANIGDIFEVIGYEREKLMVDTRNKKSYILPIYHIMTSDGVDIAPCELFEAILDEN